MLGGTEGYGLNGENHCGIHIPLLGSRERPCKVLTPKGTRTLRAPASLFSQMRILKPSLIAMLHHSDDAVQWEWLHSRVIDSGSSSSMCIVDDFAKMT